MYRLLIISCLLFYAANVFAGEVTFTGRAHIVKEDVRTAQANSLNNALIGGINSYVKANVKNRTINVTAEHFMFVNEYEIIDRIIKDDFVVTTVKININDMITQDVAVHVAGRSNTAVFVAKGLPDFARAETVRKNISDLFAEYQFTMKDQIPFEQELIDLKSRDDALMAFQSVSSQYMFEFDFNLKSFKAGESCTVATNSSYVAIADIGKRVPVLRTDITVEEASSADCFYKAVEESVRASLKQTRDKLIKSPEAQAVQTKFQLVFTGRTQLKNINTIVNDLKKRKYVSSAQMSEFFNNQAIYVVESYYSPEELSRKINELGYAEIERINITLDGALNLVLR